MLLRTIDKPWKISILTFLVIVSVGLFLVMLLNLNVVNIIYQPVLQYWSLFMILWQDNPGGAIQFIASKSILAFAHKDPRSGLNLWTYEIDSITLIVYILCALAFALIAHRYLRSREMAINPGYQASFFKHKNNLRIATLGVILLSFSFSYMTAIEHCAGATWVGFVSAYGLGADGFQLYPFYQAIVAILGFACLGYALYFSFSSSFNSPLNKDANKNSTTLSQQTNTSVG